jgi:Type IV Pilus-assembly protein W
LFSFAVAGVLAVAVSMSQGFREQRAAVAAEQAARVPLDFLADAIRQASPGAPSLPMGGSGLGVGSGLGTSGFPNIQDVGTCSWGSINILPDQTAIHDATLTGWDALDLIYASGAVVTSSRTASFTPGAAQLEITDASQLSVGDSVVISDTSQGHLLHITGISGNVLTVGTGCSGSGTLAATAYAAGSLVVRAEHAVFTLDSIDGIPTLMMDPDAGGPLTAQPLAEGIEDMQLALGVDRSGSGYAIDSGNTTDDFYGNAVGDTLITSGSIRAVRIWLVARTTSGLVGNITPYKRPAVADHAAATASDQYRRRILTTTIEIRNSVESP